MRLASTQDARLLAIVEHGAVDLTDALALRPGAGGPLLAGAFDNAREPLAQGFTPTGGGDPFLVVVNHFKSKGSAGSGALNADLFDGQGASNEDRVRQADALADVVVDGHRVGAVLPWDGFAVLGVGQGLARLR